MIVYRTGADPLHHSFDLRSLRNLRLEHHGKGFGSILIGSGTVVSSMSMGGTLLILERVGDAESVYKQIQGIL